MKLFPQDIFHINLIKHPITFVKLHSWIIIPIVVTLCWSCPVFGSSPYVQNKNQAPVAPQGGVFIPRNGGIEGIIGRSHIFLNNNEGGCLQVVDGQWPSFSELTHLDMAFKLTATSGAALEVHQSNDHSPRILFLEEGNDRLGIRVRFNLYDDQNIFHGHGMTEIWQHPDGQIFITAATMFENVSAHSAVTDARILITTEDSRKEKLPGIVDMTVPHQKVILLSPNKESGVKGLTLYWKTGQMDHNTYVYRSSFGLKGAPSFFRWPDYHRQAYTQRTIPDYINPEGEKAAWPPGRGAYLSQVVPAPDGYELHWPIEDGNNPTASFNAFFRLAAIDEAEDGQTFVAGEKELLKMEVSGGIIHGGGLGYNDQEGCYEIRKTGDNLAITIPTDPLGRTAQIKVIGLTGHGGVEVKLDNQPVVPQLSTDGGVADDPLVPIRDQPEGPANAALISVQLNDKPHTLTVKEVPGIQLVYQARDPRRNYMIFSSKNGPRWSGLEFSVIDGHARHMRAYGQENWVLTENLMQWFAYMGYTPEQMLDQLRDF
ncbi:MAG: hypothetical protein KDC53_09470, partial [Saprospiraceae bacterium]|nr:hypothetical protein [Saprospiraceae bacterium]